MDIIELEDQHSLTFDCGENPADSAVEAAGHEPNGYFWVGVVQFGFAGAGALDFDPEGSMFCAVGSPDVLEELQAFLTPLLAEPSAISALIERAEAGGVQFDD